MTLPSRRGRFGVRGFDPFGGLGDDLFDQMSRILTSALPDVARVSVRSWSPPVDVQETEEEFRVEADMPGVRPEDVTVDLHRNELRITGHYGSDQPDDQPGAGDQATRRGRFDYRVTLPGEADAEAGTAELDHGVLRLRLPKASVGRRRIQVRPAAGPQPGRAGSGEEGAPGRESGPSAAASGGGEHADEHQSAEIGKTSR